MKIAKIIGIVIVSLIALVLIVAAVTKKDYSIERQVSIHKPKQEVFDYVKFLKNQNNFSKWNLMDPNSTREYVGTDGTVGFIYKWDSQMEHVGKGEQTIVGIKEGDRVDYALHFIKPFEGDAKAYFITEEESSEQTNVKWGFSSRMPYPMNIMLLFMNMEDMLGKDLDEGLSNLKTILEK